MKVKQSILLIISIMIVFIMSACGAKDLPSDDELKLVETNLYDDLEDICEKYRANASIDTGFWKFENDGTTFYSYDVEVTVSNYTNLSAENAFNLMKELRSVSLTCQDHKDAFFSKDITIFDGAGKRYTYETESSGGTRFEYVMSGRGSVITAKNGKVIWSDFK